MGENQCQPEDGTKQVTDFFLSADRAGFSFCQTTTYIFCRSELPVK